MNAHTLPIGNPETDFRLSGPALAIGRILAVVVLVSGVALLIAGIPYRYQNLTQACQSPDPTACVQIQATAEGIESLESIGVSIEAYALFNVITESYIVLVFIISGAIVFWRRSDELIALISTVALCSFPLGAFSIVLDLRTFSPLFAAIVGIFQLLGPGLMFAVIFVFPNGRFVPRWTRWGILGWFLILIILPLLGVETLTPVFFAFAIICEGLGIYSQVYRYRNISTPAQRQQTKWAVLGFTSFLLGAIFLVAPSLIAPQILQPYFLPASTLPNIVYRSLYYLFFVIIPTSLMPLSIAISILRFRLWNVNPIINRTLVYGVLTIFLVAVFTGGFLAMNALFQALLGSEQPLLAVIIPALAIMMLFTPTRDRLRAFVDKRFYGIELDYARAVKQYDVRGRQQAPTSQTDFGQYERLELIGQGGMGEVYQAYDKEHGRTVALKMLPTHLESNEDLRRRFTREAETIAKLTHPGIIELYDFGNVDGRPYMAMEYIQGRTLSEMIAEYRKGLPPAQALNLLADIAAALDYAHERGIIHRDVKPANVMVESVTSLEPDRTQRAILMDFGIAKIQQTMTALTGAGGMVGTLDYIAPEQIQGRDDIDGRADIYSFGVMAYQMFTGQLPFRHNNPGAMVMAHLMEPPPDPRKLLPAMPGSVSEAIVKAMSKQPADRFASAGACLAAMQSA